jgi:cell fate regulator YaaT (PSP1 superfamily)
MTTNTKDIYALKSAIKSEHIKHHDNIHLPLKDIDKSIQFIELSLESHEESVNKHIASILRILNKEVLRTSSHLASHSKNMDEILGGVK